MRNALILITGAVLFSSCTRQEYDKATNSGKFENKIRVLSEELTTLEANDSLKEFMGFYDDDAISMPEYQSTLRGKNKIEAYYKEIFQRQKVIAFSRTMDELIYLDSTFIEIGTFKKEYEASNSDSIQIQNGKYWNIWSLQPNLRFKLKGEAFGFFSPLDNPRDLVVRFNEQSPHKEEVQQQIPFELRAYNALNEKYVKDGEGVLRADFYTNDSKFMPFAHPTINGMAELRPYLIQYDTHSASFWIDSISVYTYAYEYFEDYNSLLEYTKFHVKWSTPEFSGMTEGKGARIWKRQKDKSLKMYREIGTHNYVE